MLDERTEGAGSPDDEDGSSRESTIQSVSRALDVLEALRHGDLGLVELGRRTGLTPSTTHRILATLRTRGYVGKSGDGRYQLGRSSLQLANGRCVEEIRLKSIIKPFLKRIHSVAQETAHLSVLDGTHVIFIGQLRGEHAPTPLLQRELRLPAHVSASGKAMLAFERGGTDSVRVQRDQPLTAFTAETIVDATRLVRELEDIRERGYAHDRNETSEGITCIAAPIFDRGGRMAAAISVSGSTKRFSPSMHDDLGELVSTSAVEASIALQDQRPSPPAAQ